jgi:WD40 repeat protein
MSKNELTSLELLNEKELALLLPNLSSNDISQLQLSLKDKEIIKRLLRLAATPGWAKANEILANLKEESGQTNLAEIFVETSNLVARQVCVSNNWLPTKPEYLAIFYVLTDQWEMYIKIDPGNSLLAKGFVQVNLGTQRRIVSKLREVGYADVAARLIQTKYTPETLSEQLVTKSLLSSLAKQQKFSELWGLLQKTSPHLGRTILDELANNNWQPVNKDDTVIFERLLKLSRSCNSLNFTKYPISYKVEREDIAHPSLQLAQFEPNKGLLVIPFKELIWEDTGLFRQMAADGYDMDYYANVDFKIGFWNFSGKRQHELDLTMPTEWLQNFTDETRKRLMFITSLCQDNLIAFSVGIENVLNKEGALQFVHNHDDYYGIWVCKETEEGNYQQELLETVRPATEMVYNPSDNTLTVAISDKTSPNCIQEVLVFSTETFELVDREEFTPEQPVINFCLSPDGKVLAVIFSDGLIRLYTLPFCELKKEIITWQANISDIGFSSDGKLLATLPHLHLWNVENGSSAKVFNNDFSNAVDVTLSKDNNLLVLEYPYEVLKLWAYTGEQLAGLESLGSIRAIAFSRNARSLVAFTYGENIVNWKLDTEYYAFLSAEKSTYADVVELQQLLREGKLSPDEKAWLEYSYAYHGMKWRFDIELDATTEITVENYDIEIES